MSPGFVSVPGRDTPGRQTEFP